MAALTVSQCLGMLLEDPDSQAAFDGLLDALTSGNADRLGADPIRLIEAARHGHAQRAEWSTVAKLIEIELEVGAKDPDREAAMWKELARVRHEELLDDAGARTAYEKAGALRPGDYEVQDKLEQIAQVADNWKDIAKRFADEAENASDPNLRASLLARAGSLVWQYKKRGRDKEVDSLFSEALAADPSDTHAAMLYEQILREREEWSDLAKVLLNAAENAKNRDEKLNLYVRAARVCRVRLNDRGRAAACYERVLDFSPGQPEAMSFLVAYFTEKEDWDHLVAVYEDALRSRQKVDSEQGILLQLGMVQWRMRGRAEDAEPYFARLRKFDPAHPAMLDFYRDYLGKTGDEARLLTILGDAQRTSSDTGNKLRLAIEVARAAQENPATLERGIDAWKAVQRLDPENAEAHGALIDLYRRAGKWNALVEALKADLESKRDASVESRVMILREMVAVYRDRLNLDVMVINTYNAILQLLPDDEEALNSLSRTYESLGRWNDLIQVLTRQADASSNNARKVDLYSRVANLWIDRFANFNQATKPLEQVLAIAPEHREALARLKDIYAKKRAWQPLFDVLRREAELASDPTMRLSNLIELAKIAGERLHRNVDAIGIWREVIEEDATATGALDALEKLAEREKDWSTFAWVLEKRLQHTSDGSERIKLLQKLGALYAEHLNDMAKSAGAWKRVLEIEPRNGRALRTLRETFLAANDWEGLEALYGEANDWEGLVEVLGSAADRASDPAAKVALSLRAAELYENQIGEPARAFRAYERVLTVEPNNVRAANALVEIYEKDQKWQRVPALLEVILKSLAPDAPKRLQVISRLRDLTLTELRDADAALLWALEAYQAAPEDEAARRAFESIAEKAASWDTVVTAYVTRIAQAGKKGANAPNESEVLLLRRRVADISANKLQHADAAIAQLREIVVADPGDGEAIATLEKLYRAGGRFLDLRELYVSRLEHASDSMGKFGILSELAKLEENNFSDGAAAATRYRAMLEIEPNDLEALAALDRLATAAERWEELAEVLKRRRELVTDDRVRNEITLRLGLVLSERLNHPGGALDAFSELLQVVPGHGQAVAALEQLAERYPASAQDAGRLLEGAYETGGAYDKLARVLEARLAATKNESERRELRLRVAELSSGKLGNSAAAYRTLEAAFLDRPNDSDLWDRLASAANASKQHEALATAYATAIELGTGSDGLSTSDVTELSKRVAKLYDEVLERPDAAEAFHKRVLVGEALDDTSFLALKELYTNRERWDDLQLLYRNRIAETVDAESKLDLLMQVCFLFEEILDDTEKAIRAYQDVLELAPEHDSARRALERLYQRTSRFRDLAALLTGELDRASGNERIERLMQLGEIYEKHLREPSPAVDHYELVLQEAPTQMRAQESLERLLAEPSQRQRVATILEPLYDAQGGWADLVRILEVQLEDVRDPGSRVALLMRIAELSEQRLHATDRAFSALERAVLVEPSDGHSRTELARIAASRGEERARAQVLERAIEATDSDQVKSEILLEVANLWNDPIRDSEKAEAAFERLIELDPHDAERVVAASRALQVIHMQRGDHRKLVEDLRRQVRFEGDAQIRSRLLVRLAELLENTLEDAQGAVEAHRERLEHDPNDLDAMRSLERLYASLARWSDLVGVLRARDNVTNDEQGRREIAREIARILEEKVNDREAAITAYSDMLSSFGPDRETLESLSRLYEASERWSELAEVLTMEHERLLSSGSDALSVAQIRFRSAELLRLHLSAPDRAIEAYSEVLELVPQHDGTVLALESLMAEGADSEKLAAARVLLPRYEAAGLYDKLLLVFGVLAESDDPVERTRALRKAADVSDVGLHDASSAFGWMARAVRAGVGENDLGQLMIDAERLASASGRWDDYVALLRDVAPDISDGDLQIATYSRIAEIAKTRLDDLTLSRDFYLKVIEERPDDAVALDSLEEIFSATRDPEGLIDILRRKTDLASTSDARVRLLLRQAEISETQIRDVNAAIEAYEQVLSDADPVEAYRGLERLYAKAERHQDLASLFERQIDKRVGDVVEAHYALGKLSLDHLNDPGQALHHFREAVGRHSNHAASVAALESMMQSGELRGEAAEVLEPVYLARLDWQKVIASLEARITPDSDPDLRKKLLTRLAEYHEVQLEDIDSAVETYARLFREDPTDESTWDVLTRLTRTNNKWARLAEIYGAALEDISSDEPATARLSMITGRLHDEKTGDLAKAATFYHRALRFDPTDRAAFDAVESVYLRQDAQDALLALYREQADIAPDDATRLENLHKLAAIHHEIRNDASAAIDAYREVLDVAETDAVALRVLDVRYAELGRHQDLAEHLRRRIDLGAAGGDEVENKARLADLLRTHLDDHNAAIDLYEEILAKNPAHHGAIVALELLVRDEAHRLRIIQLLEPIYRKANQWKKLVAIFEAQIALVDDAMERSRILGEIGELYESKGRDGDLAFAAWARAFAEDPGSENARAQIDRLAELLGMWDAQVAAYEDAITHTQDSILVAHFLRAIAKIHDERRGDPRSAIQTYERLIAHDESDMTPFDALEGLHTMVGDWVGLVDVYTRRVERSYDAIERGELLRRIGSVREDLIGDRDGAITAFRRALDENDSDELSLTALDRLYSAGEDWEALADVLRRLVEITQEPESRAEFGRRLGQILEQNMRQPIEAIPVFERVLDDAPNDPAAVSALGRLYESQGMWNELLDNLRARAAMSADLSEKVALLSRVGEVLEMETNDVVDALAVYRDVLELQPTNVATLDALLRITKLDEYRSMAAEILEPRLREAGRYDDLAALLTHTAEGISDPIGKHAELRRIAAIHEEQRNDKASAFETLRLAFNEDPADQATSHDLERLAEGLNAWSKLAETFQGRASTVLDPNDGKRIYMRLAWILEEKLGNDAQAIEAYRRAAEITGDEDDVLAALERLYEKTHQWNELGETLDRRLQSANDPALSTELLLRLGQLREAHFGDARGAFEAYREVLDRSPQDVRAADALERLSAERGLAAEILEILERVYRDRGAMDRVAALFDKRIELAESDSEKVRLLQESASLWEHDLAQPARALQALRDAFEVDPRDEAVLSDIERLAPMTGSWEVLRGLVESISDRSELNRATRRDLHMRAAHWYRDHMQDATAAEARYRSVIELDSEATEAYNELIELLRAPGRERDLIKALRAHAAVEGDEFTKKERYREAARVAESLDEVSSAVESLEKLLEIDNGDAEALDALIHLRGREGRFDDVVALLERRIEVEASPDTRLALRKRMATVRGTELRDTKGAVQALREVLDESPDDAEAMASLESIFEKEGNHAELEQILRKRLDLAEIPSERTSVRQRLARLVETHFGRREDAINYLREVLGEEPTHQEAQNELERLYGEEHRFEDLVDLLSQRSVDAAGRGDLAEEVKILYRLATSLENNLNDKTRATSVYERVLTREPHARKALDELMRLYREQGDLANVATTMERMLGAERGPAAVQTALALADLAANELHDDARAEDAMRLAIELDPSATEAREKLKAHYESRSKYRELAEMLSAESESAVNAAEKVEAFRRIAALYSEKLGDPGTAALTLERAVELAPDDRGILLPLCELYMAAGRQADAVPVLRRIIASFGGKRTKEVAQYHHRLAQALEGAGDRQAALAEYDAAFKLDLTNVAILRDLGKITHSLGDWDRAQKTFRALLLQKLDASSGISKADVYFYLGDISHKQNDTPKAINMLERALAEDKTHARATDMLRVLKG